MYEFPGDDTPIIKGSALTGAAKATKGEIGMPSVVRLVEAWTATSQTQNAPLTAHS